MRYAVVALGFALILQPVDNPAATAFVRALQQAVARNDRNAVAGMIHYPLTVFTGGVRIPVTDASDLVQSYDAVFSPALKLVIAEATMGGRRSAPHVSPIDVDGGRVMIAGDAVQIERMDGRFVITGIHAPLAVGSTRTNGRAVESGGRKPRRIGISFGRIQHPGLLARGQRDAFLLSARRNQALDVRIIGVSGRDIVFEIINVKTRSPIDAKAKSGVRTWVGRIPEDGDYRIDVIRLASGGAASLPYTLLLSLR